MNNEEKKSLAKRYVLSPKIVWREVEEEAVILDLRQARYYSLNAAGLCVLKTIVAAGEKGANLAELTEELVTNFEVEEEKASADLRLLAADLEGEGIITPHADGD